MNKPYSSIIAFLLILFIAGVASLTPPRQNNNSTPAPAYSINLNVPEKQPPAFKTGWVRCNGELFKAGYRIVANYNADNSDETYVGYTPEGSKESQGSTLSWVKQELQDHMEDRLEFVGQLPTKPCVNKK